MTASDKMHHTRAGKVTMTHALYSEFSEAIRARESVMSLLFYSSYGLRRFGKDEAVHFKKNFFLGVLFAVGHAIYELSIDHFGRLV